IEQIRSIYRNTTPGTVTTLVCVTVLTGGLVYINAAVTSRAEIFLTIMFVQTIARLFLYHAYLRRPDTDRNWRRWAFWFTVGAFVGGMTNGSGAIWMVSSEHTDLQLIALLLVFAVTGGAVGAFGAYLPAFYSFFFAISVTPAIWLFMQDDALH